LAVIWVDFLNRVLEHIELYGISKDDISVAGFPQTLFLAQYGELALVESPNGPRAAVRSTQLARRDVLIPLLASDANRPYEVSEAVVEDVLMAIRRMARHSEANPHAAYTDSAGLDLLVNRTGWERTRSPYRGWNGVSFRDSAYRVRGELAPSALHQRWGLYGGMTLTLSFSDVGTLEVSEILRTARRIADELRTKRNHLDGGESQLDEHHHGEGFIQVPPATPPPSASQRPSCNPTSVPLSRVPF
jgi:hypothetical protein